MDVIGVSTAVSTVDLDALRNDIREMKQKAVEVEEEIAKMLVRVDAVLQHCQGPGGVLPGYANPAPSRNPAIRIVSNVAYVLALALVGVMLLISSMTGGSQNVLGYSVFTVLTSSMRSVYPKDSMILVRNVDPKDIQVGDDITYMRDEESTITHRVITIYENYENSGMRGFQTQGVNNSRPDNDIVYAVNVVGRVVYHIPQVGLILRMVHDNIYLVILLCALVIALIEVIRRLLVSDRDKQRVLPEEALSEDTLPEEILSEESFLEEALAEEPPPDG